MSDHDAVEFLYHPHRHGVEDGTKRIGSVARCHCGAIVRWQGNIHFPGYYWHKLSEKELRQLRSRGVPV